MSHACTCLMSDSTTTETRRSGTGIRSERVIQSLTGRHAAPAGTLAGPQAAATPNQASTRVDRHPEKRRRGRQLSVRDALRLWHFRLQLDHLAIHNEPTVSAMVDRFRILLRRIGPGLEHFKDKEIVLVDETGIGHLTFEIGEALRH